MKFFAFWLGIFGWMVLQVTAQNLTDPADILTKSREAYEHCETCVVEGQLRSDFKTEPPRTVTKDMRLMFSRTDDLLRLDWTEQGAGHDGRDTNSVFTRGGKTYFYWSSLNRFELPASRRMALAAATGISSGLAHFLPSMLLHQGNPLTVKDPVLRPEETLDGQPCYVVAGTGRDGDPVEFAVDQHTFAVVRVREIYHIKSQGHNQAVAILKKTNPEAAAKLEAMPSQPDFDVDRFIKYTTKFGVPVTAQDCDYPVPAGMHLSEER